MKKHYISIIFFLISLFTHAQMTFQNGYGDTIQDEGRIVLTSQSGDYVIVGTCGQHVPDLADPVIFFLDSDGGVVYSYKVGTYGDEFAGGAVQTDDENFIIVGTTHASSIDTSNTDIFAVKISNLGGFVHWSKVYGGAGNEEANSIMRTPDGNFIILGSTTSLGSAPQSALALQINEDGDQLWCNVNNTTNFNYFDCGTVTADSNFILAGGCNDGIDFDNYIVKMDTMGTILWSKRYASAGSEWINDIQSTSDSGFITAGIITSQPAGGDTNQCIMKFESTGVPAWSYNYGTILRDQAMAIQPVSNDRFLICGYSAVVFNGGIANQMVIDEIDTSGNLSWSRTFGDTAVRCEGLDIVPGLDGGFAASGTTLGFGDPHGDIFLIKTDTLISSGCFEFPIGLTRDTVIFADSSGSIDQLVILNEASDSLLLTPYFNQGTQNCFYDFIPGQEDFVFMKLFPSPAGQTIHVESNLSQATVAIFDHLGRLVMKQKLSAESESLDISLFNRGVYILELSDGNHFARKKFLKL